MPKHRTSCQDDSLKVNSSLWLTNPSLTQDDQIKKGTREDSRHDKSDWQKTKRRRRKLDPHSMQEDSKTRLQLTVKRRRKQASTKHKESQDTDRWTNPTYALLNNSNWSTMHIHKMITIKFICISPSNFFTVHSTQLTQEIILNINSTKKEKRLREEGPKKMRKESRN